MKKQNKNSLYLSVVFFALFAIWTVLVSFVNVANIGPNESKIGFAAINGFVHNLTGVNFTLYNITDWLGLVPFAVAFFFAVLGLVQLIQRKSLKKVDYNIFVLGAFYIVTIAVYILFEKVVINYRPVLINGVLEASYPSSTTMLVLTVIPTAIMQLKNRIKNTTLKNSVICLMVAFILFMVIARLISGVHWFSDIVGGVLLSAGLVKIYCYAVNLR